jgi:hypothetical protein
MLDQVRLQSALLGRPAGALVPGGLEGDSTQAAARRSIWPLTVTGNDVRIASSGKEIGMKTTCTGSGKPTIANETTNRHNLANYSECSHCSRKFNKTAVGSSAPRHILNSVIHANAEKLILEQAGKTVNWLFFG